MLEALFCELGATGSKMRAHLAFGNNGFRQTEYLIRPVATSLAPFDPALAPFGFPSAIWDPRRLFLVPPGAILVRKVGMKKNGFVRQAGMKKTGFVRASMHEVIRFGP